MSLDGVVCSMVLGALFCFGQHSSTAPMKRFRDDTYKFSYRYPLYLEAKPSAAAEALLSDTPCIKMPLDARRATSADHDVLEIIEIDFACLGRHADADVMDSVVMKNAGGSLKAFGGQPRLGKPHRYSLNGLAAEYLEASVDAPSVRRGWFYISDLSVS